ncbi:MAG TPA: hypothetical protein VF043_05335 [Ktedonobacteraceae bacterium]
MTATRQKMSLRRCPTWRGKAAQAQSTRALPGPTPPGTVLPLRTGGDLGFLVERLKLLVLIHRPRSVTQSHG